MITRTEAIALRSVDYGETSQIVTLFTRLHGKMTVIAKGSRGTRARFGSTLQPMSYSQVVFYYRPGRNIHSLSEASHVRTWRNLTRDLPRIGLGLRTVELVNALFLEGDAHERLFDVLVATLARLESEHERPENLWPYFQLRLATELGFAPAFDKREIEAVRDICYVSLADGRVAAAADSGSVRVERVVLRAFAVFARADLESAVRLRLEPSVAKRVDNLVESYLRYHVERAYPTRAAAVIERLRTP